MMIASDLDDDFVHTISDEDPLQPFPGEESFDNLNTSTKPEQGKKRKRDTNGGEAQIEEIDRKAKKYKKKIKPIGDPAENGVMDQDYEAETWTAQGEDDGAMNSDFEFQIGDLGSGIAEDFDGWGLSGTTVESAGRGRGDKQGVDIDELIARRWGRAEGVIFDEKASEKALDLYGGSDVLGEEEDSEKGPQDEDPNEDETLAGDGFGMAASLDDEEDGAAVSGEQQDPNQSSDEEEVADPMPEPDDVEGDDSAAENNEREERARREAFFAPEDPASKANDKNSSRSFQTMSLARPILRGLAAVGFTNPTPIQNKTIPVALLGKDVVGGAVTGSGKTAAFIIPILERLLYRPKKVPTSRVAILMPTRELAVQCFTVAKKLASFTDVTFCQLVGGFSLREQESVLRSRPDVIIATPGRFIDHMRNSASFTVDTLEILVLDEADRMLEDGFADELNEILTTIPKSRQTMLFSATMTNKVDKLIRVGLNRPVRLMVDARKQTVGTLIQEFVRLRPGREEKRMGYLLYLCKEVFTERVIIFFRQKKEAHRARIIFGLCGIKAGELHGSMTQEQRITSLTSFRTTTTTHLCATDLASRGLDIPSISTVLNYSTPQSHEIYLHRVGRTARAGRAGRACTIAAEPDRKVVREIVRSARAQGAKVVSRVVDSSIADEWAGKVDGLEAEVEAVLRDEKEEKALDENAMQIRKGENYLAHADEIHARPQRTWFESTREKAKAKEMGRVELNGPGGGGKLSNKMKKRLDDGRERVEGRVWKKGRERGGGGGKGRERGGGAGGKERRGGRAGERGGERGKSRGGRGGGGKKR